MPEQAYWESLVDVALTVARFEFLQYRDVAEMGCGYGTFTEAVAREIAGTLFAYDVDPEMVELTRQRTRNLNVSAIERDILDEGFEVQVDAVMLFNILHCEEPQKLLLLAAAAAPHILVTHWIEGSTPRGPSADIRPSRRAIALWAADCFLEVERIFPLPPWHFGMILKRSLSKVSDRARRQSNQVQS